MSRPARASTLPLLATSIALFTPLAAQAEIPVNPIHPTLVPRTASAATATTSARVSSDVTCSGCHDVAYIAAHSSHSGPGRAATCIQCHVDGGALEFTADSLDATGALPREALRIGSPRPSNCSRCHGLVFDGQAPVLIPADFDAAAHVDARASLTLTQGAIISPQRMGDSFLSLASKASLDGPWDVHAAKLVECTGCHRTSNDPSAEDARERGLAYVTVDPRRASTAEFLVRPDHELTARSCRSCHDASVSHAFLPYRERHLDVIACATCHIPGPMAPVAELVDATLAGPSGAPIVHYRNVTRAADGSMNTRMIEPMRPLFVERLDGDGVRRLTAVNVVTRYRWVAGPGRDEVPFAAVASVFVRGAGLSEAATTLLDADHSGAVEAPELRLDTAAKVAFVAAGLQAAGYEAPAIDGSLTVYPLAHGVESRSRALRACETCHSESSRFAEAFPITPFLPGGVPPRPATPNEALAGLIAPDANGGLAFHVPEDVMKRDLYVLGATRHAWSNQLGYLLFLVVSLALAAHGLLRVVLHLVRGPAHAAHAGATKRVRVFGLYERFWHWTMAFSGLVLIATGLLIHNAGAAWLGGLQDIVWLHNAFAAVLIVNAFLSLFYHTVTVAIRSFIPRPEGFLASVMSHVSYQSHGIFRGAAHPPQAPDEKLNPLQQVTYLALLNILFPVQIGTGILIWAVGRWPAIASSVDGLRLVAPIHNLGAWLFLTFFVLHVYLVTTGRTVGEHLGSMVTGYRDAEVEEPTP